MSEEGIYGVIAEFKIGPIIMESYPGTLDAAHERMAKMVADPRVIRVAIFRAVYESGNQTLIPGESV